MPEPDCFLRYRMRCNTEFYYVGKIPRTCIERAPVAAATRGFKMVYSPRAVGTTLSEVQVHALRPLSVFLVH